MNNMTTRPLGYTHFVLFFFTVLMGPFIIDETNAASSSSRENRFSIAVTNEALREVFASIAEQTGYRLVYDKAWDSVPISIVLHDVALDTGLKRILKSRNINYFITYDDDKKVVSIDIITNKPTVDGKRDLADKDNAGFERDPNHVDFVPPDDGGAVRPGGVLRYPSDDDTGDETGNASEVELVPPDDLEDHGLTQGESVDISGEGEKDEGGDDFPDMDSDMDLVPPGDD